MKATSAAGDKKKKTPLLPSQWTTCKDCIISLIHYRENCWLQLFWLVFIYTYLAQEVFYALLDITV